MPPSSLARRTFLPVVGGFVALVVLAGALWLIAAGLSRRDDLNLGDRVFDLGPAENRARSIAEDRAPFLFPDVRSGTLDIYVNHFGVNPSTGWVAFAARVPGSARRCTLAFPPGGTSFVDPCTQTTWPADGTGLPGYSITVADNGHLLVDLTRTASTPTAGTPTAGPVTTS